ncbi:MAG: FAD-binding protein [Acetobacteraceae bacterium]|nr:FAD-binding protein [Acetobacteraceae bacterium]
MSSLIIAEHDNSSLKPATLCTVTAAAKLGGDIHVLLAGDRCSAVAERAANVQGVSKVRVAEAPYYADACAEDLACLIAANAAGYACILFPATTWGKNIAPRVAASLDVAQISEIIGIEAPDTFIRPLYAGNVLATLTSSDPVKVITVRATAFDPAPEGGHAVIEAIAPGPDLGISRLVGRELTTSVRPELSAAKIVVSGGRGLGSSENYHNILEPLADRLGAALGASRAAVDAGFVSNDYQVGQTGKVVAPQLYIAVGISGAIQHLAGMKDSKVIVAINKDPEAPIFQVADYGLVGDLFQIVPEFVGLLG